MLLVGVGVLIGFWATGNAVTNPDPFAYSVAARELWDGKALYREIWADRPFLAVAFFLIPHLIQPGSYTTIQVVFGCFVLLQAIVLFLLARRWSERAAWIAAAAYLLLPFVLPGMPVASANHFSNPFILLLLYLALKVAKTRTFSIQDCAVAGLSLGFLFQIRQNTILTALVPALLIASSPGSARRKFHGLMAAAGGFLAVTALLFVVVAAVGDLREYLYVLLTYPKKYVLNVSYAGILSSLEILISSFVNSGFFAISIIAISILVYRLILEKQTSLLLFSATAVFVGLVNCVSPLKAFSHYWASWIPFLAVFFFLLAEEEETSLQSTGGLISIGSLVYLGVVFVLVALNAGIRPFWDIFRAQYSPVVQTMEKLAGPSDTVLGLGIDTIYLLYESRLHPALAFPWDYQLSPGWENLRPRTDEEVRGDLERSPPNFIVASKEIFASPEDVSPRDFRADLWRRYQSDTAYKLAADINGWKVLQRQP